MISRDLAERDLVDERFLRLPEVISRTGLSRSTIYAYVQLGIFPAPVRLGARAVGWLKSEVDNWIAERAAAAAAKRRRVG